MKHSLVSAGLFVLALTLAACADSPTDPVSNPNDQLNLSFNGETVAVWWPTDGAWLQGLHRLEAKFAERPLTEYKMYWQVDGGSLVQMTNTNVGGPHKQAWVDFTGWNWNGSGPYTLNFIAKDTRGRKLAETAVRIWIGTAPTVRSNPFAGARLYVDPNSNAAQQAAAWRATRPEDAGLMDRIAANSQADWIGDWLADVQGYTDWRTSTIAAAGALPVYVLYNIPVRDCNSYSAGGATSPDAYKTFVRAFANGIGSRKAVVIVEPDALGLLDCLTPENQQVRLDLIRDAIAVLRAKSQVYVYVDAGNAHWLPADVMADRLTRAGIDGADGFALNISNFQTTADNLGYGTALSGLVGGKHFLIDTSRNGLGPTADFQWCNPDGRALGAAPTATTGHALADAFLWIKRPGESDGTCNGGPSAGAWWAEYALGLASRVVIVTP